MELVFHPSPQGRDEKRAPLKTPACEARHKAFNSSCDLFIRIVLNFNFELKVLTDPNKRSEMLRSVNVYSVMIFRAVSSYL